MIKGKYLDDLMLGDSFETGGVTLTEGAIVDFALVHDPQPFHIDKIAATESIFGGLIASGFQTIALTFRLFRDTGVLNGTNLGGHGMDEVRWLAPVFSGDTICVRVTVEAITPSHSKPDRGTVRFRYRTYNQKDIEVLSFIIDHVMARRGLADSARPTREAKRTK
ncbi:MaoC family dehydratase [Ruegeria sp. HKCCA5763]|uniref:MaoC family dehydratase n=1 Tax=Ruegeria sp. HKCCA5763 TaxID=2682987 RepID=UPI001C2C4042|nr:MaoC family dehydratase [Ruegeria sp. HKCCA5763]